MVGHSSGGTACRRQVVALEAVTVMTLDADRGVDAEPATALPDPPSAGAPAFRLSRTRRGGRGGGSSEGRPAARFFAIARLGTIAKASREGLDLLREASGELDFLDVALELDHGAFRARLATPGWAGWW